MKVKKIMLAVCLLLVILTVGAVSASNDSNADVLNLSSDSVLDEFVEDSTLESVENDIYGDSDKAFSDIQTLVDDAHGSNVIVLSGKYVGSGSPINIGKALTINGNGATLDAKELSSAFSITADNVVLKNINFVNCHNINKYGSVYGGAINWKGAHGSLLNCTFENCKVSTSSGDYHAQGGAVYMDGSYCSVEDCTFVNCGATNRYSNNYFHARGSNSHGGAIYLDSGADHATVKNCRFMNSTAYAYAYSLDNRRLSSDTSSYSYGGAIYWKGGQGSLEGCNFENSLAKAESLSDHSNVRGCSTAYSYGGAVCWDADGGSISNCAFVDSTAMASAVAGYGNTNVQSSTYGYGGALYLKGSSKQVSGCRFVNSGVDLKSGCVDIINGGIIWDVSGTSSRYSVNGYGGAIYFDSNCNGNVAGSSFVQCSVNGDFNNVVSNAKSVADSTFVPKLSASFSASAITATYGVSKRLTATLKDGGGNPLKSVRVTIKIGTISKTLTTDDRGQVSMDVSGMVPNGYTAKIAFDGNANYRATSADVKVTVLKATPKLTAKAKTFKKSQKTKKYSITLLDNQNKPISSAQVTIKVNKKTYSAKTNAKGKATFKIKKLTKKGTFKSTVTFKGDKFYNKVTKKATIKVK